MANVRKGKPRGFGSKDTADKVERARRLVLKRYPEMNPTLANQYLVGLGAGRVLALAEHEANQEDKPATKPLKGQTALKLPKAKPAAKAITKAKGKKLVKPVKPVKAKPAAKPIAKGVKVRKPVKAKPAAIPAPTAAHAEYEEVKEAKDETKSEE